jgi:glycosidase
MSQMTREPLVTTLANAAATSDAVANLNGTNLTGVNKSKRSQTRRMMLRRSLTTALLVFASWTALAIPGFASSLRISAGSKTRIPTEVEADYTTSHVFVNEVAGDSVSITVFFDPQTLGVETAEVFTNLNRRDRAAQDADHDGIEDGIKPPSGNTIAVGDDRNYYKAYKMNLVSGGYQLTLDASRCGAYRLTARYRMQGEPAGTYHWYGAENNGQGILKRDHAIVVSPASARSMQMYEVNPLTMIATGTSPERRGTFGDLANGLPPGQGPRFSLNYLKRLGCNTIWLQPIHPRGLAGRETDPSTNQPYELGSPYAVRNFFEVMPLMAKAFVPGSTPAANDTAAGRTQAMKEFHDFVRAADSAGINIILDAPFNHSAEDVELAAAGQKYWGNPGSNATTGIRAVEARFFSRDGAYDMRAHDAFSTAHAPDRSDFGKWPDVFDIFFGRYAALVPNDGQRQNYTNEGDWFDYSSGDENSAGNGNGHFDAITQNVWRYFGDYLQSWLTQTGYPENPGGTSIDSSAGIDGLRADFGQGLPPQCWEYLVNRTRTRKWNFVFMAESLDGGPVTYRSARHFDILNESVIYDLHHAMDTNAFRQIYEQRRNSYGAALVLLNTSSHDEDNYLDPWEALLRFAVNSTIDGVTMVFPGQELGLKGTIIPPHDANPGAGQPFGYERYDRPFFGKPVPGFKTYNSLMPLWRLNATSGDVEHLSNLYSAIGVSRQASRALRSRNRVLLNLQDNTPHGQIFSIAKFEQRNAGPDTRDVVFAFVNLVVGANVATPPGNSFNVNVDVDGDHVNDFGIRPERLYNVKNIAAYTGVDPHRRDAFLWGAGRRGSDILQNGIFVQLNRVPNDQAGWGTAPYEPQYLKLFDVTPHARGSRSSPAKVAGSKPATRSDAINSLQASSR